MTASLTVPQECILVVVNVIIDHATREYNLFFNDSS